MSRRRGKSSNDRGEYLGQLVQEYETTESLEAKQQILANLANFAYDPFNYNWLWQLNVVQLFLDAIVGADPTLQEFGAGGLANICLEPQHHQYLASDRQHIRSMISCLAQGTATHNTYLNIMTTLMYLIDDTCRSVILTDTLKQRLMQLARNPSDNSVRTMATLFLQDYFSHDASTKHDKA